jgi:hypothetical protein
VHCGDCHTSELYQKNRDLSAKCALCTGSHPANYKGCPHFKNLQNCRNQFQQQFKQKSSSKENGNPNLFIKTNPNPTVISESTNKTFPQLSYSQITQKNNKQPSISFQDELSPPENLTVQLSSFINDLKSQSTYLSVNYSHQ